jgi:hypothetical protein
MDRQDMDCQDMDRRGNAYAHGGSAAAATTACERATIRPIVLGGTAMKLKDIDRVNHLIAELGAVKELIRITEQSDPADLKLYIKGPGDTSIEMSAEGEESTHYRGFSATPGFLARLKELALAELVARHQAILDELARLGVEAE